MKNIVSNFKPQEGYHCISNSLKQVFQSNGYPISEEMIIGLARGLNFMYFDTKNLDTPIIGGRNKIGEFEENLARSLNIGLKISETKSVKKAYSSAKRMIENDQSVIIYAQMAYLPYLHMPKDYFFGGHAIVVFGIDEDKGVAYVSDRDSDNKRITMSKEETPADFHEITLKQLEKARNAPEKPYPPKNRWLELDFTDAKKIDKDIIFSAIYKTMQAMKNPPIKNLGLKGIKTFAEKLKDWKEFDDDKLKASAISAYIMINQVGGNGGGCFRRMYGNFLIESSKLLEMDFLQSAGDSYLRLSENWDNIGFIMKEIFENGDRRLLNDVKEGLCIISIRETELTKSLLDFVVK